MGFEQLAALKQQLAAQAKQQRAEQAKQRTERGGPQHAQQGKQQGKQQSAAYHAKLARTEQHGQQRSVAQGNKLVDPVVEAIWRLQKCFPKAFPKKPEPKLPLKLGIHIDAMQHAKKLGLTEAQIKDAIATWCQGNRYWSCLVEHAARVDLQGNPVGEVSAPQAARARWLASRRSHPHGGAKRQRADAKTDAVGSSNEAHRAKTSSQPAQPPSAHASVDAQQMECRDAPSAEAHGTTQDPKTNLD
ncbi:ProQ/FinO family protein [Mycetohabitans sp. B8]|uniref:ProQ/FinO family protein n=1 Tax=Mycetohabitans sp. B8 TaxID=2841845 RepID=UPI001F479BF6|nr:ProQ/FinO family protein [Mycetohabitans sp. B8]MCG1042071.1 ProQ/FinO family protein [Mycetohabitans sp. B8]